MNTPLDELKRLHEIYKTGRFSKLGISIALGVDRRTVRRWFQGTSLPTEKHLKVIENLAAQLRKYLVEIKKQNYYTP